MPHTLSLFFWVVGYYTRLLAQPLLLVCCKIQIILEGHHHWDSRRHIIPIWFLGIFLVVLEEITNTLKSTKKATTSTAE